MGHERHIQAPKWKYLLRSDTSNWLWNVSSHITAILMSLARRIDRQGREHVRVRCTSVLSGRIITHVVSDEYFWTDSEYVFKIYIFILIFNLTLRDMQRSRSIAASYFFRTIIMERPRRQTLNRQIEKREKPWRMREATRSNRQIGCGVLLF